MQTRACESLTVTAMALAALASSGCSEPDWIRVIGTVNISGDRSISVTLPGQLLSGTEFDLTIQTFGSSNCTRTDGIDVAITGNVARVVPYDDVPAPNSTSCFRNAIPLPHTHAAQFPNSGPATVRVAGQFGQGSEAMLDSVDIAVEVGP